MAEPADAPAAVEVRAPARGGVKVSVGSIQAGRRVVVASRVAVFNIDASSSYEEDDSEESSSSDEYDEGESSSDVYIVGKAKKTGSVKKKITKSKRPVHKK